jgi:hypothetical protein
VTDVPVNGRFDEVRVMTLPPPQTAAVNRLLREEEDWYLLDVRVTQHVAPEGAETMVVYVLGHARRSG